ncbi:hypothetical protein N1E27_15920 [Pseudomonas aeruginosa]|nr:hypothetical protein [Pseudomonas aeruginosa]MCS9497602.1 hypothetical protein [Pseudomonas aeruginosa]MCS9603464.1 hypothetical protein [Pseudomonas aeruginosa]MCT1296432.1 hypothetical protein [Pseudomonas aeruginosa]
MKKLLIAALSFPLVAVSAPSEKDKAEVAAIVERSGENLGGLIECDRQDLRDEYVKVLRDALAVYPGTDPIKVRALIRQIERKGEAIGRMGIKSIPEPTAEDLSRQRDLCGLQVVDAKKDIRALDDFILK